MRTITLSLFLIKLSVFAAYGQEKTLDENALNLRVTQIDISIDSINTIINKINDRTSTRELTEEEALFITERLAYLNNEKQQLENVRFSITAATEGERSGSERIQIISKEEFDAMPERNRKEVLAHPERYKVED